MDLAEHSRINYLRRLQIKLNYNKSMRGENWNTQRKTSPNSVENQQTQSM